MDNLKILSLYLLLLFSFSSNFYAEITAAQEEMLESLPPDQREALMGKMDKRDALTDEVEESFEESNSLIERPELEVLSDECADCIYGYDFFKYSPTTFAPTSDAPVPFDYILGPGDQLEFNFYGSNNSKKVAYISREGEVVLPLFGPVNLLGLTFSEAREFLNQKAKNELIGTEVSASLKKLRSISIYILGEAYKPGKYTVSALSSVINALFVSGGVNVNGSLRTIQVKRNNKVISTYDFYDFLLKGSTESNIKLQDGDVIFIPFIENRVTVGGAFKRPGNFEFIQGETIGDAISIAGGLTFEASREHPFEVSTINNISFVRELIYVNQMSESIERTMSNGDVINLPIKTGMKSETIKVSGEVRNPGVYSIQPSDTILDIITRAGGYNDNSYSEGAIFLRQSVAELQKQSYIRTADDLERMMIDALSSGNLNNLPSDGLLPLYNLIKKLRTEDPLGRQVVNLNYLQLKTDPITNFTVMDKDSLYIPRRPNAVAVVGEVLNSSTHAFDPKLSAQEYIELSGGYNDFADKDRVFVILPNGQAQIMKRKLFGSRLSLLPGTTVVVSRDSNPFDILELTGIITPVLADLATSAAAIAAISND
jgi:protein involved in polysaccharide export with SLBB domain